MGHPVERNIDELLDEKVPGVTFEPPIEDGKLLNCMSKNCTTSDVSPERATKKFATIEPLRKPVICTAQIENL